MSFRTPLLIFLIAVSLTACGTTKRQPQPEPADLDPVPTSLAEEQDRQVRNL